ncbi:unnamed protein product [Didymodactylos carnosus]|uniref:Uncharacterized protein n=1 Tax=Didymodactylos carnosus TaxID=1234261 RepID=A0A814C2Q1_9BILA|nr:unnamed protein product [Didymodactylos carnosus]CAF3711907.1 unnamed protein product [Didymodactylos carnosus]
MPVGDGVFFRPTNPSSDQRPVMNQPRDANKHPKTSLSAIILGTSIMTNKRPSYVILSDSHLKHIPQQHYDIYTIAKSGLQWIDRYDTQTSAQYKVATEHAKLISTRDTIVLAIGTNTLRHTKFVDAIEQVKNIISLIRKQHQHLSFPSQIIVTLCFACKKESAKFPTAASLSDNIDQYNRSLISLAATSHFTVIDCGIQEQHIANDKIHINVKFRHLVFDAILNQLDHNHLLPSLLMPPRSRSQFKSSSSILSPPSSHSLPSKTPIIEQFAAPSAAPVPHHHHSAHQRSKTRQSSHCKQMKNIVSSKKYQAKDYDIRLHRVIYHKFKIGEIKQVLRGLKLRWRNLNKKFVDGKCRKHLE